MIPTIEKRSGVNRGAFFDLERTLTPHAVEQTCALELKRRGELSWSHLFRVLVIYLKYDLGLLKDFDSMKRFGAHIFTDRDFPRIVEMARAFHRDRLSAELFPDALALVDRLRAAGVHVYIISSTYRFLVDLYAEQLGAAASYGVDLEVVDSRCTGAIVGMIPHGQTKAAAVRELAARDRLALDESFAFGDSLNDLPMLEAVGHPYAVNPAGGLRRLANERGWPILRWKAAAPAHLGDRHRSKQES
jgi:HAD superfamily hydrolase (TIGR01490 family)